MTTNNVFPLATLAGADAYPYLAYHQRHQPHHQLCRYRSKVCNNPRAHKRDGSLHRYCEEHRQRANSNQKKWAKRRMQAFDSSDFHALRQMLDPHNRQLFAPIPPAPVEAIAFSSCSSAVSDNNAAPPSPIEVHATTATSWVDPFPGMSLLAFDGDMLWFALGLDEPLAQIDASSRIV